MQAQKSACSPRMTRAFRGFPGQRPHTTWLIHHAGQGIPENGGILAAALRRRPSASQPGIASGSAPAVRHSPAAWRASGSSSSPPMRPPSRRRPRLAGRPGRRRARAARRPRRLPRRRSALATGPDDGHGHAWATQAAQKARSSGPPAVSVRVKSLLRWRRIGDLNPGGPTALKFSDLWGAVSVFLTAGHDLAAC